MIMSLFPRVLSMFLEVPHNYKKNFTNSYVYKNRQTVTLISNTYMDTDFKKFSEVTSI